MTKCKKWLQTILPILFLLLSLLPIKETFAAETDPVYDKIIQKGELVVGLSADYAPYEFHAKVDGEDKICLLYTS
ncbi:ABC transporter permease, partial [Enterococcus sp. S157_ASV_20]|nr:ABC transporter permease [Enterococcus sp. S157_ASV_20]